MLSVILPLSAILGQGGDRYLFEALSDNCCYDFSYVLDASDPDFNAFEIRFPEQISLSSLTLNFSEGWFVEELFNANGYRFYLSDFAAIPVESNHLLQLCLDNGLELLSADLEIRWCINSACLTRDSVRFSCAACDIPLRDSIVCADSAGYELWLQFTNQSDFPVNYIDIYGADSSSMAAVEAMLLVLPDGLLPGETSDWLLVPLGQAAEAQGEICLDVSTQNIQDSIRYDCCQSIHCISLPACDRCCQDEDGFFADVSAGFDLDVFGLNEECAAVDILVTPLQLTDCDLTQISRRRIGETTTIGLISSGNQPAQFNGVAVGGFYEFCLSVTRTNFSGESCFMDSTLSVCDTILVDCVNDVYYFDQGPPPVVFPNPTNNKIWLDRAINSNMSIATLLTINGRMVYRQAISSNGEVDLSNLPAGVYILLLSDNYGQRYVHRIVKR